MMKSAALLLFCLFPAIFCFAQEGFNYDESKTGTYLLPEILRMSDGTKVSSAEEWEKLRRPQILKLFEDQVYGQVPKDYDKLSFEVKNLDREAMDGKATLKEVDIRVFRKGKSVTIHLVMFTPNRVKRAPIFLVINHRGMKTMDVTRQNRDGFWPAEEVVEAGYGIAGFDVIDFAPDHKVNYTKGVLDQLYPEQMEMDNGMAALGAWGWGASRAIDYFEKDPSVDASKVMTVGHSRGGKASLWCGAQDRRVAITFSNESGNSGAALSRRIFGETVARITSSFPYWFCRNYRQYADNEDKLPVDQHMLLALMAPRPVYVASASEDLWADPKGQYLALIEAQPAYRLYGFKTDLPGEMPAVDQQLISLPLGFHNRTGKHNMTPFDWQQFIRFADAHFKSSPTAKRVSPDPSVLLTRIDLNRQGLEKVKAASDNPEQAMKALLDYYRSRTSVKHFTDRNDKASSQGKIAGSGDITMADNALKHIFVGQSAYPPYFCGDDINWGTRPVPDNEWVWQLNRLNFWDALGKVYWHTADEKYAKEWAFQLADWVSKNPNDREHAHAWRSIEAGIRGNKIPGWFQRFIDSPVFTPELLTAFLTTCHDHASYLMTKYSTKSNWGLMEAEGMAAIAIFFPEFKESESWKSEAIRRLNNEISLQVYPDGHQRELAMGYHLGCINWFKRTYELARLNGITDAFPPAYLQTIEKMCEVPMKLCFPDGTNAQFGDAWAGTPGQHNGSFREWAEFYGREDFLYLATDGKKGSPPAQTAYALPQSGLYSLRSGWTPKDICLVLKCGPDGGGHSQPDNGTFSLYAGGRTLMPDAGSYIYSGDPENRAWFRQTMVHQTLTLDNKNARYAPKLLQWKPGKNLDVLVVENQSYDNLAHRRAIFFVDKRYFIVYDEAVGTSIGEIGLHFQLAPGEALFNNTDYSVKSAYDEGWNVLVRSNPQSGLRLEEEEGLVSYKYTIKESRPAFAFKIDKKTPQQAVRYVTLVAPYEGEPPGIRVELMGNPDPGSSEVSLKVTEKGKSRIIGYKL